MIVTVTMNPAIDKTLELDVFSHGGLNRIKNSVSDAGGKGINVSKTICSIGGETIATGFLGVGQSQVILDCLQKENIKNNFVFVDGITRTNTKVVEKDGTLTELNEQGMTVPHGKVGELIEKLMGYAKEDTLFILAGSIPKGVDTDIYARIINAVRECGSKVFVDADGELFVKALEAVPSIIKPNHVELCEYFDYKQEADEGQIVDFGKRLLEKGIETIAVSRGSKGAIFLTKDKAIRCNGLKVLARSSVGAGDAMVAALSYAISKNMSFEDSIKLSVAVSAGAVTTVGTKPPTKELVDELMKQVVIEDINK